MAQEGNHYSMKVSRMTGKYNLAFGSYLKVYYWWAD